MDKYLQALLQEITTLIFPGIGALTITNDKTNEIMFMPYLKYDDGKLSQYMAEKEGISDLEAKNIIAKHVQNIQTQLDKGESYNMFKFGSFSKDSSGEIVFVQWVESNLIENQPNKELVLETPSNDKSTEIVFDLTSEKIEVIPEIEPLETSKQAEKEITWDIIPESESMQTDSIEIVAGNVEKSSGSNLNIGDSLDFLLQNQNTSIKTNTGLDDLLNEKVDGNLVDSKTEEKQDEVDRIKEEIINQEIINQEIINNEIINQEIINKEIINNEIATVLASDNNEKSDFIYEKPIIETPSELADKPESHLEPIILLTNDQIPVSEESVPGIEQENSLNSNKQDEILTTTNIVSKEKKSMFSRKKTVVASENNATMQDAPTVIVPVIQRKKSRFIYLAIPILLLLGGYLTSLFLYDKLAVKYPIMSKYAWLFGKSGKNESASVLSNDSIKLADTIPTTTADPSLLIEEPLENSETENTQNNISSNETSGEIENLERDGNKGDNQKPSVEPIKPKPKNPAVILSNSTNKYAVIVGAFGDANNANRYVSKLKKEGNDASIAGTKGNLTLVAISSHASKSEASAALELIKPTMPGAWIK